MSEDGPEPQKPLSKRTWLRRSLLALAAVLLLLVALLLAIPPLASSNWTRGKVEQTLANATGRPASLRLLSLGWSDGLRLEGLRIGHGGLQDESFLCSLERLRVRFGLLSALRRDLRLDIELSGLRLRHRLEPGPTAPAPPSAKPLPTLLKDALNTLREGLKPAPRQGDAHVLVDLSDIALRLDIAASNSTLDLRDAALRLDLPGLSAGPARLDARLTAVLNGRQLAPVTCAVRLEGLLDKAGLLAPAGALLTAKAEAPGLRLTAQGSVARGFRADLRLDLRLATPPLKALAGPAVPEASGVLALGLTASQPDPDHLALGLAVAGEDLRAFGGPLGDRPVGPLSLNLLQDCAFDLHDGTLRLPGSLSLLKRSAVRWQGEVSGLNEARPKVVLSVRPLHLQLDELVSSARAWLPPGLSLGAATLDAEGLGLQAGLPDKAGEKPRLEAEVHGLVLEARDISHSSGTRASGIKRLSLAQARLRLDSARATLPGGDPGRVELKGALELAGLRQAGPTPLGVKRIALPNVNAAIDGFAQDPAALFGVTGKASLDLAAEAQGVDIPGKAQVPALNQTLQLRADLPAAKTLSASLDALGLDASLVRVQSPGKRAMETPFSLRLSAPDIRLVGLSLAGLSVSDAKLSLDAGQALHCAALSSLSGSPSGSPSGSVVRSSGGLTLDVQKLLALAAPLLPQRAKGSGGAALDWKLAAALPQQQGPAAKQEKLSQAIKRLGFLKELEAVLRLTDVSLDWPLAATAEKPGETLRLRGLTTPRPLRLATTDGLRESSLSGSLIFGPMSELPGTGPLDKPLRGLLTVNAAQQGARSVQFSQLLHLDGPDKGGLDLDQNLRLTLDRLDQVLDHDQDRLAAILEHVDGSAAFGLTAGLQSLPAKARKDGTASALTGTGRVEAGFDARLSGGRSLAVSARLLSPGLDLRLGPELALSGLTSSLRLDKRYTLAPGLRCPESAFGAVLPLSEQVFEQLPTGGLGGNDNFARNALHGFQPGGGSLGFSQLKLKSGALPLSVHDVSLRLDTSGPLPALRSFRAGLLGGNIQGSAMITGQRGAYSLETDLAYTGIDPSRLFPAKAAKDLGDQAETAGRVNLTMPLTPDPETLLQRMALRADITKVGPRTLERFLYALDPDEQNESIVQQRRLMGIGYPRLVRLGLAYGNLSLSGEVEVKGFRLDLPRIDRLPVANLPIRAQLAKALAPIRALIKTLDAVSAGSICRDPADPGGTLKLPGNTAQEGVTP